MHKEIGCITHATFGFGGYQDVQFGLSIRFSGKAWGSAEFRGPWAGPPGAHCEWTEENQAARFGETCRFLRDVLRAAGVQTVDQLVGIPVEATFDDHLKLISWRILDEALPKQVSA